MCLTSIKPIGRSSIQLCVNQFRFVFLQVVRHYIQNPLISKNNAIPRKVHQNDVVQKYSIICNTDLFVHVIIIKHTETYFLTSHPPVYFISQRITNVRIQNPSSSLITFLPPSPPHILHHIESLKGNNNDDDNNNSNMLFVKFSIAELWGEKKNFIHETVSKIQFHTSIVSIYFRRSRSIFVLHIIFCLLFHRSRLFCFFSFSDKFTRLHNRFCRNFSLWHVKMEIFVRVEENYRRFDDSAGTLFLYENVQIDVNV